MGERLIKPYEISVWEDKLTPNGFIEKKLAVIGSDTMTGLNKVYDPVFNKKVNGEKTLSFSLKYKYFDPYSGNSDYINPFTALLINERKIKLYYDEQWYEFIIKDHTESSDGLIWTYTCSDAFVLELSKTGYNITFDSELNNNQGTAEELAKETLKATDWRVGDANIGRQMIAEPIYRGTINGSFSALNTDTGVEEVCSGDVYVFYSYVKNHDGKFVQFIKQANTYTVDDNNVITATNYRILRDNIVVTDTTIDSGNVTLINVNDIETHYQANRLVYGQRTTYDPVMKRTVDLFKTGDREIYKYTDYTYTTSNVVMNYITNGDNFNVLENGSLQGWNPYVGGGNVTKLELVTKPELGTGKELADLTVLSQIEGYLKANFTGDTTAGYKAIFNSGIENNSSFIESIAKGDRFVFRWRAGTGSSVDNLTETQNLRLLVAGYTQDAANPYRNYYKYIDANNIILNFSGTPTVLNNYIRGGVMRVGEDDKLAYFIDDVVQTPSTKYIYVNKDNDIEYVWNSTNGQFEIKTNSNYFQYYYLTGTATKAISSKDLSDPTKKFGIFIYTTNNTSPVYIQEIQLTRLIEDANNQPILVGNIPTAAAKTTDYYYVKPSDDMAAEDIETYTSIQALASDIGVSAEQIKPVYNDDSEKILSISASQSNCFNILQTIAETFECWVDIVVSHDERGYITYTNGKPNKFIYLREYAGKDNYAGFKYGINIDSIERQVNSDEIVTKLIVDLSQSDYTDEGYVSISNAPSNQSGESYILNFDYYYNQGLLDKTEAEADRLQFIADIAKINLQLQEEEKQKRNLEASLTEIESKRNVFTELVETAQDTQTRALGEFEQLTNGISYEDYRALHSTLEEEDQLTEEETVFDVLGEIYSSSATINNYSGLLSNIEQEYWTIYDRLYGSDNYTVKVWVERDINLVRHVFIELNDYLPDFEFQIGNDTGVSTVNCKYWDIITNENTITFTVPSSYTISSESYIINDNKVAKFKISSNDTIFGIEDDIQDLQDQKDELTKEFNNKYSRYIQEGTWSSTDYIDSELYYLDALQVSNTSAQPTVSYTINVVEISELEGFKWYLFDAGDKTYIEDTEFFGWANINGHLTPAREEVIVAEVEWHLEEPENNIITVQNYKTRFEDLFQRISAAVQTVQYNEATYAKISSLLDANGTINQDVLLESLNRISGQRYNLTSDGSVVINGDQILVRNLTNPANCVIINSEGIRISSDGGQTWRTAIDGQGINIGTVYTGTLNTQNVVIGSSDNPSFRWDKSGISAYRLNNESEVYDLQTYVRYDQFGLYGIKNGGAFKAQTLNDVLNKAHFAVTWDGFFIKNSYPGGGRVEITSDNDFRVMNIPEGQISEQEKIKIGALEWGKNGNTPILSPDAPGATNAPTLYGIRINNNAGQTVMKTGDDGNLEITGTIYANAGEIGGMSVNNTKLKMDHIVLEPGTGIYSDWGESSVYPFIISDKDGSATFNNVIVRGSIKTSVFEYEEIQAVGGAFMFRPSTAIKTAAADNGDLVLTVEKPLILRDGAWYKLSNYNSDDTIDADELTTYGLTHIYQLNKTKINDETEIRLIGGAAILQTINIDDIPGGSIIDMGFEPNTYRPMKLIEESSPVALHLYELVNGEYVLTSDITVIPDKTYYKEWYQAGINNYGIGINSSDNYINLPPRAISLFETIVNHNQDPKVSYKYRGILGTLPQMRYSGNNPQVNELYHNYLEGTQGIYTDNMYLGDHDQYITFYEDDNGNKQLRIRANQIMFEVADPAPDQDPWQDIADFNPEGTPGPAGQDAIRVAIESNVGNEFILSQEVATLTCTVYRGAEDVTSQVTKFLWVKNQANGSPDTTWNAAHEDYNLPYIEVTPSEINKKAVFGCRVTLPE